MVLVDGELFEEFAVANFLEADPVRRSHNWVGFSGVEALQGEQHHVALRLANPATGQWLGIDSPGYRLHLDANSEAQVAYHQMLRAGLAHERQRKSSACRTCRHTRGLCASTAQALGPPRRGQTRRLPRSLRGRLT